MPHGIFFLFVLACKSLPSANRLYENSIAPFIVLPANGDATKWWRHLRVEDTAPHSLSSYRRGTAENRLAVMNFELIAIQLQQRVPAVTFGDGRRLVEWRLRLLIRHFQEEQNVNCST